MRCLSLAFRVLVSAGIAGAAYLAPLPGFGDSAHAASCRSGLGVHRTATLRTTGGARYGTSHGRAIDFLRKGEVVLTFDDGPYPSTTPAVLRELSRHCTKATFFMLGRMAAAHPGLARQVVRRGHTIAVHGHRHINMGRSSAARAIRDIETGGKAIAKAAGRQPARFFRYPYLSENRAVNAYLGKKGMGVFAIDVDAIDYRMSSPQRMVRRVIGQLRKKGKGIILMHDTKRVTAKGLGMLLDALKQNGFKVVHIRSRGGVRRSPALSVSYSDAIRRRAEERARLIETMRKADIKDDTEYEARASHS